ncbi:DGQHR domain-containing protein [Halomonas sp. DP5N14-9]|uniref:DGQHR domain-containing protein n=1 Tax=Halomonas sp. DP5N14-9 TaxID=2859075 RepID=UPI001C997AD9|nr:DGQHR domain-containing protein [Halomonas sp. DP5N14-9]MBY5941567.1 DGQHR domain-containing protein [Halomonas sp. DP5N14-9]
MVAGKKSKTMTNVPKRNVLDRIFLGCGFKEISSDGVHFYIDGKQGEIDKIFYYENLVVICEETKGKDKDNSHLPKKRFFHGLIRDDYLRFVKQYRAANSGFDDFCKESEYREDDFVFKHIYHSEVKEIDASSGHVFPFLIFGKKNAIYFDSLVKTIGRSARFEMFKYLGVALSELGEQKIAGRSGNILVDSFNAFMLSGRQTNYPDGFYIASFYADPKSLISRAYVLRRDGWEHPDYSYQRILKRNKIKKMREHLSEDEKVFVNNLIVTLPHDVTVSKLRDGKEVQLDMKDVNEVEPVSLKIPRELGVVGIIDGQHRVFSYHEGYDEFENNIKKMRGRQNLLVTGIVFPEDYTSEQRVKFEAELFLKINNTQDTVPAELRQHLELIVKPLTPLALSKAIVDHLALNGPLKGLLQQSSLDGSDKVKTSSIVNYVLSRVVALESRGDNAFSKLWLSVKGEKVSESLRGEYVEFCANEINAALVGFKKNMKKDCWLPKASSDEGVLSPTFINSVIICLREAVGGGQLSASSNGEIERPDYSVAFRGIDSSSIRQAGSSTSAWSKLGVDLYKNFLAY